MEIIFLRHGETVWNRSGKWQGHTDVPLSDAGRNQAKVASEKLKGEKIDAIFSSDLTRAYETARIVAENLETDDIIIDMNLRERNLGEIEGKTTLQISQIVGMNIEIADIVGNDLPVKGLEPIEMQFNRARKFLNFINNRYEKILVVSHGVMIGIMLNIITGEDFRSRKIENCEIIRAQYNGFSL